MFLVVIVLVFTFFFSKIQILDVPRRNAEKKEKGPDKMFKTQLNCAPYVAPSDLKEIQHLVRAFALNWKNFRETKDWIYLFVNFVKLDFLLKKYFSLL